MLLYSGRGSCATRPHSEYRDCFHSSLLILWLNNRMGLHWLNIVQCKDHWQPAKKVKSLLHSDNWRLWGPIPARIHSLATAVNCLQATDLQKFFFFLIDGTQVSAPKEQTDIWTAEGPHRSVPRPPHIYIFLSFGSTRTTMRFQSQILPGMTYPSNLILYCFMLLKAATSIYPHIPLNAVSPGMRWQWRGRFIHTFLH